MQGIYSKPLAVVVPQALVACLGGVHAPFTWSTVIFMVSFVGLAASLYPYLVPPEMSLAVSASSSVTLVFMLAGIGMLIPVMLVYNGFQYLVFRGKLPRLPPECDPVSGDTGPGDAVPGDHKNAGRILAESGGY